MFVNLNKTSVYNLFDLEIVFDVELSKTGAKANYIQFFNTDSAVKLDNARKFYYYQKKWWKFGTPMDSVATDFEINPGEGFLCHFGEASARIRFKGQVISSGSDVKTMTIPRPADYQNFVAYNPSGAVVDLSQITISFDVVLSKTGAKANYIQFFTDASAIKLDNTRKYYYYQGDWWKVGTPVDSKVTDKTVVQLQPGEGVFCHFGEPTAKITFPTSL